MGITISYPEAEKYWADIAAGLGEPGEQEAAAAAQYDPSQDVAGEVKQFHMGSYQTYTRPDGSTYQVAVNSDGSPIAPSPTYTQAEYDSGIRIGGDTRTAEQIAADEAKQQDEYQSRLDAYNTQPAAPAPAPTAPAPTPTAPAQAPQPEVLPEAPSSATSGGMIPGVSNAGQAAFNYGNGSVSIVKTNSDGTITWGVWDGSKTTNETLTADQFAQKYGVDLALQYYSDQVGSTGQYPIQSWGTNSFTSEGNDYGYSVNPDGTIAFKRLTGDKFDFGNLQPLDFARYFGADALRRIMNESGAGGGTAGGGGSAVQGPGGTISDPGTVGTADWSVQAGHSLTLPDGGTLSVTSVNPDGTITWRRSDGSVFANVSRDVFESLLGKEAADQWYGKMTPGSIGGVARVEGMRDAMPEGNALPERFQPAQIQPYTREIDFGKETVQGQLQGMLASGSPLLQRAEAGAAAAANQRGLINSTMAVQSGRAAIYDVALKIAEMDANIYNAKSRDNMQALNAADAANVAAANQFIGTQLAAELQITQTNAQLQADIAKITAEGAIRLDIANAESTAKIEQILIDANARKVMQANASASTLLQNTIGAINTIMLNKDGFDANAKDEMIGRQITMFKTGIALIEEMGGDVNLSGYLDQLNMALGIGEDGTTLARAPRADDQYQTQIYQPGGAGTSTNLTNYDLTGRFSDN